MRWNHTIVTGLCCAGFALAFIVGIPHFIHVISVYDNEASPRFFPYLVASVMLLLSIYLVASEWFGLHRTSSPDPASQEPSPNLPAETLLSKHDDRRAVLHVFSAFGIVCFGVFAVYAVGFYAATTLILLGLMLSMGVRSKRALVMAGCIWPLFLYLVFAKGFALQFPLGGVF